MMHKQRVLVGALAAMLLAAPAMAWTPDCNAVPDFRAILLALDANSLAQMLKDEVGEWASFHPDTMDFNGGFVEEPEIQVFGNGMLDEKEMSLISAFLANPGLDFTATGGCSHQMMYDAWCTNITAVYDIILQGNSFHLLTIAVPGLETVLAGFFTIGAPNDAGIMVELLSLVNESEDVVAMIGEIGIPTHNDLSYMCKYISECGDADGDGCTNKQEYDHFGAASFVQAATDPSMVSPTCELPEMCLCAGEEPPIPPCTYVADFDQSGADAVAGLNGVADAGMLSLLGLSYATMDFEGGDTWIDWYEGGQIGTEPTIGDGVPDSWQAAMMGRILCYNWADDFYAEKTWVGYYEDIRTAYDTNATLFVNGMNTLIAGEPAGPRQTMWQALADDANAATGEVNGSIVVAMLTMSDELRAAAIRLFELDAIGMTWADAPKPCRAAADPDNDGSDNLAEYNAVKDCTEGDAKESYILEALYNSGIHPCNTGLPVGGGLGLAVLMGLFAAGGAAVLRRK